jgi:isocitrate dehydrogenase (NAD+)
MLVFLGEDSTAQRVDGALRRVLREGRAVTPDLGGKATTEEMCREIIRYL